MEKTEIPGVYKVEDGVFVNKNAEALAMYKKKKDQSLRLEKAENEISVLKDDISEIKRMLNLLMNK